MIALIVIGLCLVSAYVGYRLGHNSAADEYCNRYCNALRRAGDAGQEAWLMRRRLMDVEQEHSRRLWQVQHDMALAAAKESRDG